VRAQVDGLSPASVDRGISGASSFPSRPIQAALARTPGRVKSGAGYFYDDVLDIASGCIPNEGQAAGGP